MTPVAMRTRITTVLALLACLVGPGCSVSLGRPFPAENLPGIVVGVTTEAELLTMFGEPIFQRTLAAGDFESTVLGWGSGTSTASGNQGRELHAEIVGGVVNGFLFASSLPPDSTDFDLSLAGSLREGASSLADAEQLLGAPDGRLEVPSNILVDWFGPMKSLRAPAGATRAYVYCFMDLATQYEAGMRHVKLLVLFAGPDGTLRAVRRFDGTR